MDWNQLRTILWLRWRLTRNQWSRGSPVNAIIAMMVAGLVVIAGVSGGFLGLLAGGVFLRSRPAPDLLALWDMLFGVFLFFWVIGLVSEIQRSESIDIGRMLHLPVSLKQVFFINYLASHLTLGIILFIPGMLGLCLGLALGRGWLMLGLLPLVVGAVFMVTAWTYCLRGWLVTLMSNPRRRRTIIALMAFLAVMVGQLPNLFSFAQGGLPHLKRQPGTMPRQIMIAHQVVPFLWVGNGAMGLAQGNVLPALWGAAASFGIGALGLRRAYRTTVRFYQGYVREKLPPVKTAALSRRAAASVFTERQLPGVPEEAAAMALATLRSMSRAPEVKMALAMNIVFLLIFGGTFLFKRSRALEDAFKPFIATGMIAFMCFSLVQLLFNQFGYDRAGFRALVLSPARRRWILLGKNLALLPVVLGLGGLLLLLVKFSVDVPALVILATALQLLGIFLALCLVGNLASMLAPYRMTPGSLKPTKMPAGTVFLTFLLHLLFPLIVAPAFLAPIGGGFMNLVGWLPAATGNLLISTLLLALAGLCYYRFLPPLGELLQRREKRILDVVTHEVE